ncbi:MAG: hypothetical protein E7363_03535 [Clostridiales bacterium]|nr:hypothetical protein [Clostridiales bacterium]
MLKATLHLNPDYFLYYVVTVGEEVVASGGLDRTYTFTLEKGTGIYRELLLRATINLVMDGPFTTVFAKDEFGVPLSIFGFTQKDGVWQAEKEELKLPHFCRAEGEKR